mmetsp:Transcript_11911/g.25124  ORF Transcript_11911/g.25124 Transcript_11911/m.25124 type:complete len:90 (+) Transcript_11911:37-306(+)
MPHRTRYCLQKPSHDIIEKIQLQNTSPRNDSGANSLFNRSRIVNPASHGSAFIYFYLSMAYSLRRNIQISNIALRRQEYAQFQNTPNRR